MTQWIVDYKSFIGQLTLTQGWILIWVSFEFLLFIAIFSKLFVEKMNETEFAF